MTLLLLPTSAQLRIQAYASSSLHFKQRRCPAMALKTPAPQTKHAALNSEGIFEAQIRAAC